MKKKQKNNKTQLIKEVKELKGCFLYLDKYNQKKQVKNELSNLADKTINI